MYKALGNKGGRSSRKNKNKHGIIWGAIGSDLSAIEPYIFNYFKYLFLFFLTQGYDVYRAVHKYYGSQNGKSEDAYGKADNSICFQALILALNHIYLLTNFIFYNSKI